MHEYVSMLHTHIHATSTHTHTCDMGTYTCDMGTHIRATWARIYMRHQHTHIHAYCQATLMRLPRLTGMYTCMYACACTYINAYINITALHSPPEHTHKHLYTHDIKYF